MSVREKLEQRFPSDDFFFETGGMIRHILNGGALAPIEVQVHGRDTNSRRAVAKAARLAHQPNSAGEGNLSAAERWICRSSTSRWTARPPPV